MSNEEFGHSTQIGELHFRFRGLHFRFREFRFKLEALFDRFSSDLGVEHF
jgi:hypothetical protein